METLSTFLYTFLLVFVGELGDKTQIAAGTGALANRGRVRIIFLSSALALIAVAGLTVLFAGIIPAAWIPTIETVGGVLLIGYGGYLFLTAGNEDEDEETSTADGLKLFFIHFAVVFTAELGDKTQIVTLAAAVENQSVLPFVFAASASALVAVTALTVWGVAQIPAGWIKRIQQIGAVLMALFGLYMIFF